MPTKIYKNENQNSSLQIQLKLVSAPSAANISQEPFQNLQNPSRPSPPLPQAAAQYTNITRARAAYNSICRETERDRERETSQLSSP